MGVTRAATSKALLAAVEVSSEFEEQGFSKTFGRFHVELLRPFARMDAPPPDADTEDAAPAPSARTVPSYFAPLAVSVATPHVRFAGPQPDSETGRSRSPRRSQVQLARLEFAPQARVPEYDG